MTDRICALACSALLLGLLLLHTLLAPAWRGPDEPHHFDLAREWSLDADYDVVERYISSQVESTLGIVQFGNRSRNLQADAAPPRAERPRFDELGPDEPSGAYNQISQHPPLYTVMVGSAVAAVDAVEPGPRWAFDRELGLVRLLTVLLVAPVPFLVFRAGRVLGLSPLAALIGGLVPASIPQFTHINALANNDALAVLVAAGVTYVVARLLRETRTIGLLVALGATCGLGLLTKNFIVGPMAAAALALLWVWWRDRVPVRRVLVESAVVIVATVVAGGWWLIRNLLVLGALQPKGPALLPPAPDDFEPDPWRWFDTFRGVFPTTVFGKFGWLELPLGWRWVQASMLVLGIGLVLALWRAVRTRAPLGPVEFGVLSSPLVLLTAIVMYQTYRGYVSTALFSGMQGRYLFSALPFVAILVGAGYGALRGRWVALAGAVFLAWIAAVQLRAATTMLGYYWGPVDASLRTQVDAMLAWDPWPSWVAVLFAAVALAGFGLVGWTVAHLSATPTPGIRRSTGDQSGS